MKTVRKQQRKKERKKETSERKKERKKQRKKAKKKERKKETQSHVVVIFDFIAEGVVLAVSELAEIRIAVTKNHCNFSHSADNRGVKAAVTTMAETVAGIRTAGMTVDTVTIAAEM